VNDPPVISPIAFDIAPNMLMHLKVDLSAVTDPDTGDGGFTFTPTLADVHNGTCPPDVAISNINAATGTFDVLPAASWTNPCDLSYAVQDNGNGAPGNIGVTNTLTLNPVGPVLLFVDNAAPGGGDGRWDGTNGRAFKTIQEAAALSFFAPRAIFVASGIGPYNELVNAGHPTTLVGQAVTGASFYSALTGLAAPTGTDAGPPIGGVRPLVNGSVTLNQGGGLYALDVTSTGPGDAVFIQNTTAGIGHATLTHGGLKIQGAIPAAAVFNDVDIHADSGAEPFYLFACPSPFAFDQDSEITGVNSGTLMVFGCNPGVRFDGPVGITAASGLTAIEINSGRALFAGGVTTSANNGTAFQSSFSTIGVCPYQGCTAGPSGPLVNTATATGGTALIVQGGTISSEGITFQSLFSTGGYNGVYVAPDTQQGRFEVTGVSGVSGSGGVIDNASNVGFNAVVDEVHVANMTLVDSPNAGFMDAFTSNSNIINDLRNVHLHHSHSRGMNVTGPVTIADVIITDSGSSSSHNGLRLAEPGPGASVTNTVIQRSGDTDLVIGHINPDASDVTISGCTVESISSDAIDINGNGGSLSLTIAQSRLSGFSSYGVEAFAYADVDLTFFDNVVQGGSSYATGVTVFVNAGLGRVHMEANGTGPFSNGQAMQVSTALYLVTSGGGATGEGRGSVISNRVVSGSPGAGAFWFNHQSLGKMVAEVRGNIVNLNTAVNFYASATGSIAGVNALTVTGNQWQGTGPGFSLGTQDAATCLAFGGPGPLANIDPGPPLPTTTFNLYSYGAGNWLLPGYTGGATDTAAVSTFLVGQNVIPGPANVGALGSGGFSNSPAGKPCEPPGF
jgi:hypothetical protein